MNINLLVYRRMNIFLPAQMMIYMNHQI